MNNAQISFLDGTFSLIHIPLDLYSAFLQPLLQVLLPSQELDSLDVKGEGLSYDNRHGFLNISITPVECSVVCHSSWAKNVFEPAIKRLPRDVSKTVTISKDAYLILSIISTSMQAGGRVMELTSPLAMAGIPIFFITTYFSDFILVPSKDRQTVVKALLAENFQVSAEESTFVSGNSVSHVRGKSSTSNPPSTPPPSTLAELQKRTFDLLRKRNVIPYIQPDLTLVQLSGREVSQTFEYSGRSENGNGSRRSWLDDVNTKLYTSLISVLAQQPRFLSVTLAQDDAPSLLLDKSLLKVFGDALNGDAEGDLVPVFLDLDELPLEATGIVSGVAGKLVGEIEVDELSYLSTARAGAVILSKDRADQALDVLKPLLEKER